MSPKKEKPDQAGAPAKTGPCCGVACVEPLYFVEQGKPSKTRFATVAICAVCRKVCGDPRLDWAEGNEPLLAIQKLYNYTSWDMMKERGTHRPLIFEFRAGIGILVPEGYQGSVRVQTDLPGADA